MPEGPTQLARRERRGSARPVWPGFLGVLAAAVASVVACGEFDDYRFEYARAADVPRGAVGEPWQGSEAVRLTLAPVTIDLPLAGTPSVDFLGEPAVQLDGLVRSSQLTANPERYRYDFTATDGYNLLAKRGRLDLLPSFADLAHGYLYRHIDGDLRVGWLDSEQPWGSAVSAYRVKSMNGGQVTLLDATP